MRRILSPVRLPIPTLRHGSQFDFSTSGREADFLPAGGVLQWKKMLRISVLTLLAAAAFAQNPGDLFNPPPAKVDKALRARIDEFYGDHVKQQFHKADALVAADTKEFFYIQNKPAYLSCEIQRIEYSQKFTRAKATILCEQIVMMPGFAEQAA